MLFKTELYLRYFKERVLTKYVILNLNNLQLPANTFVTCSFNFNVLLRKCFDYETICVVEVYCEFLFAV